MNKTLAIIKPDAVQSGKTSKIVAHLEHLECEDAADDDGADQDQAEGAQGDPERPPSAAPARRPGFGRGVTGKRPRRTSPRPCVSPGHRGRGGDG